MGYFGYLILCLPQEQTLLLQKNSNDNQLAQLGEVEKHFNILSRQCAMVTQVHEKLQQNGKERTHFVLFV